MISQILEKLAVARRARALEDGGPRLQPARMRRLSGVFAALTVTCMASAPALADDHLLLADPDAADNDEREVIGLLLALEVIVIGGGGALTAGLVGHKVAKGGTPDTTLLGLTFTAGVLNLGAAGIFTAVGLEELDDDEQMGAGLLAIAGLHALVGLTDIVIAGVGVAARPRDKPRYALFPVVAPVANGEVATGFGFSVTGF